jgi:hypothetical protein
MARIYIETTVFSFYFNARPEPEMVARENWSRRWLDRALAGSDELVTSLAVKSELDAGEFPHKTDMLALAAQIPLLALNDAIAEVVESPCHAQRSWWRRPTSCCRILPPMQLPGHLELPSHCQRKQIWAYPSSQ